jgi:hypothetical protein
MRPGAWADRGQRVSEASARVQAVEWPQASERTVPGQARVAAARIQTDVQARPTAMPRRPRQPRIPAGSGCHRLPEHDLPKMERLDPGRSESVRPPHGFVHQRAAVTVGLSSPPAVAVLGQAWGTGGPPDRPGGPRSGRTPPRQTAPVGHRRGSCRLSVAPREDRRAGSRGQEATLTTARRQCRPPPPQG